MLSWFSVSNTLIRFVCHVIITVSVIQYPRCKFEIFPWEWWRGWGQTGWFIIFALFFFLEPPRATLAMTQFSATFQINWWNENRCCVELLLWHGWFRVRVLLDFGVVEPKTNFQPTTTSAYQTKQNNMGKHAIILSVRFGRCGCFYLPINTNHFC